MNQEWGQGHRKCLILRVRNSELSLPTNELKLLKKSVSELIFLE